MSSHSMRARKQAQTPNGCSRGVTAFSVWLGPKGWPVNGLSIASSRIKRPLYTKESLAMGG